MRRFKASEFQELRELGSELAKACGSAPSCVFGEHGQEPVAPTLARHAEPDEYGPRLHADLAQWAKDFCLHADTAHFSKAVDLLAPQDHLADICATLLFPLPIAPTVNFTRRSSNGQRNDAMKCWRLHWRKSRRDELPRHFRSTPYVFEFVIDIGAYRDLHRHRRCQQFRQPYTNRLGYETPELLLKCGADTIYESALRVCRQGHCPIAATCRAVSLAVCGAFTLLVQDGLRGA